MEVINAKNAAYPLFGLPLLTWVILLVANDVQPFSWDGFKLVSVVVTVSSFMVALFIRYLWKMRIFKGWLVLVPNLNGEWKGNLVSDYKDAVNPIDTSLSIHQRLDKISCDLKTGESASKSLVAGFLVDKDRNEVCLVYSYSNRPKNEHRHRSEIHNGTAELTVNHDGTLSGYYWTDRKTRGDINLKRAKS